MARVRSPLGVLRKILGESPHPIWMLDPQRIVVFVNRAAESWLGTTGDKILGRRCDYHWEVSSSSDNEPLATLAPPPEVYATARMIRAPRPAPCGRESGDSSVVFIPLQGPTGAIDSVLAVGSSPDGRLPAPLCPATDDISEAHELHVQLGRLRRQLRSLYDLPQLIGESSAIQRVRNQIELAAHSGSRVVIQGPPGSGREHVARTIHYLDTEANPRALVPLSCSLLDNELLQAALHDFLWNPVGFAEDLDESSRVTLLLLEVDLLSPETQVALLDAVRNDALEIRTLATSTHSLVDMAAEGRYCLELAYFLSTLSIELPPLRERREDIPLLVQHLVEHHNAAASRQLDGCTPAALDRLVEYEWPGNLDQLAHLVREACRRCAGSHVDIQDLPDVLDRADEAVAHPRRSTEPIQLDLFLEQVEAELLRRAMQQSKGNRAHAARLLGISRARLLRRLEQLQIEL
jgi:DNA-binding NtrC family response regulator